MGLAGLAPRAAAWAARRGPRLGLGRARRGLRRGLGGRRVPWHTLALHDAQGLDTEQAPDLVACRVDEAHLVACRDVRRADDAQHLLRVVHDVLLAARDRPGDADGIKALGLELPQRHVRVPGGIKGKDLTEGNRRLQDHAVLVRLVARELWSRGKVDATPSQPTRS